MRKAAVFDLDGPIFYHPLFYRATSERYFIYYLFRKFRLFNPLNFLSFVYESLKEKDFTVSKIYYRGMNFTKLNSLANKLFSEKNIITHITKKSLEKISKHREEGRLLILISGSPQFIVDSLNKLLNFDIAIGTAIEIRNGKLTGRVTSHPVGEKKAKILNELSKKYEISLPESYGYGNSFKDIFFLEKLGFPVAVNPDKKLKEIAQRKFWKIDYWK